MPILPSTLSLPWRATALAALAALTLPHAALAGATDWKRSGDSYYRLEADGNLSCYSEDGVSCKPGERSEDESLIQPLVCGAAYEDLYGSTGYDTAGHWCNHVYAIHFARWRDYSPLGIPLLLSETPNNDPMCWSYDGVNCDWGQPGERPPLPELAPLQPLVCGKAHQTQWGVTGYETSTPDHWCQSARIVASDRDGDLRVDTTRGEDGAVVQTVRLPDWSLKENATYLSTRMSSVGSRTKVAVHDKHRDGIFSTRTGVAHGPDAALRLVRENGIATWASTGLWNREMLPATANAGASGGLAQNVLTIEYSGVPDSFSVPDPKFVLSVKRKPPRH